MPKLDEAAKAWENEISERFGKAVLARRRALGLSGLEVADRTKALGYPITRVALSKIENNKRAGKIDIAEAFVLAAVLEIPPVLLLFRDYPDGEVRVLPELHADSVAAARWLSGASPLPAEKTGDGLKISPGNAGVELVEEVETLHALRMQSLQSLIRQRRGGAAMADLIAQQEGEAIHAIEKVKATLWVEDD